MKISVCVNTWRLGTFDSVVTSLEAQQLPEGLAWSDVECIFADELHRWRSGQLAGRLAKCPFLVKHMPVERSLFPVASTMRAGNTCIRNADPSSELLVHVCDGAVLPPNFLAEHWAAYQRDPKAIGICPYRGRTVKPGAWSLPMMGAWEMVEACVRAVWDREYDVPPEALWTGFRARLCYFVPEKPLDVESICVPLDPVNPQGGAPSLGVEPGTVVNEWFGHYKVDAVPLAAYRAVNGWDEEYDGGYIYADIDMTLRLMAAGYTPKVINCEVPILDFHLVTKRTADVAFRQHHMAALLGATKARLKLTPTGYACVEGLSRPVRSHEHDAFKIAGSPSSVRLTVQRPWLPAGLTTIEASPSDAFIWERVNPPVLYGWKPLELFLGAAAVSGSGPWPCAVLRSLTNDLEAAAASVEPGGRLLFTGGEDDANTFIDWANANGWPCVAEELQDGSCGVMAVKPKAVA